MNKVYEAINLKNKIKTHPHFLRCLNSYGYQNFTNKKNELDFKCSVYFKVLEEKEDLIYHNIKLKNKKLEYDEFKEMKSQEFETIERQYINELENKKTQCNNILNNLRNDMINEESKQNNELSHINQDIAYLENQINQLINNKIKNEAMNEIMEKQFKADADAEINELKK